MKSEEDTFDVAGLRTEHVSAELEAFSHGDGHVPALPPPAPGTLPPAGTSAMPPPPVPLRPGGAKMQQIRW